jgi:hypothetical protein
MKRRLAFLMGTVATLLVLGPAAAAFAQTVDGIDAGSQDWNRPAVTLAVAQVKNQAGVTVREAEDTNGQDDQGMNTEPVAEKQAELKSGDTGAEVSSVDKGASNDTTVTVDDKGHSSQDPLSKDVSGSKSPDKADTSVDTSKDTKSPDKQSQDKPGTSQDSPNHNTQDKSGPSNDGKSSADQGSNSNGKDG